MVKLYEDKHKLTEASSGSTTMLINSSNANNVKKAMDELWDLDCVVMVIPTDEVDDGPAIPWDADVSVEGTNLVLEGGVTSGGPSNGTFVAKIPISRYQSILTLEVDASSQEDHDKVVSILAKYKLNK